MAGLLRMLLAVVGLLAGRPAGGELLAGTAEVFIDDSPDTSQLGADTPLPHPGDPFAVPQMVGEFHQLWEEGLLPLEVPSLAGGSAGTTYGTEEGPGTVVPLALLAKIGLGVLKAAKIVQKGATAAGEAVQEGLGELVEGDLGGGGGTRDDAPPQDTTQILAQSAGTAVALFSGPTVGEVGPPTPGRGGGALPRGELFFAQAFLADGSVSSTVVSGQFEGLPKGATYRLQVLDSETCAAVASFQGSRTTLLGTLTPDAKGRAALLLSTSDLKVMGPTSVIGRAVVVLKNSQDESEANVPVTCAVVGSQPQSQRDPQPQSQSDPQP